MVRVRRTSFAVAAMLALAACGDRTTRRDSDVTTTASSSSVVSEAPEAFRTSGTPDGFQWVGDPAFEGVVPVPGGGYWMASPEMIDRQPGAPGLSVTFEVLPDSADLTDAEVEEVAQRYGDTGDRVRIEIDDARGWMEVQPGFTNIVLVRADDVLVLAGGQVSSTELMTILGDLEPIDLPAGLPTSGDGILFQL